MSASSVGYMTRNARRCKDCDGIIIRFGGRWVHDKPPRDGHKARV